MCIYIYIHLFITIICHISLSLSLFICIYIYIHIYIYIYIYIYIHRWHSSISSDAPRGSSVKIGAIQRILAWPVRKDDAHIEKWTHIYVAFVIYYLSWFLFSVSLSISCVFSLVYFFYILFVVIFFFKIVFILSSFFLAIKHTCNTVLHRATSSARIHFYNFVIFSYLTYLISYLDLL